MSFGPDDVRAVMDGTAPRQMVRVVLTGSTCAEPCWFAHEEVCRCSCGGRNHGCLNIPGAKRPERTCKIGGATYRLKAIGKYAEIVAEACEINRQAGYRSVEKPSLVIGGQSRSWTPQEIENARSIGTDMWWSQYTYTWRVTDDGAPARLKPASIGQRKWTELSGWKDTPGVYLLWENTTPLQRPTTLVVDKQTGEPLPDQTPTRCHA